MTTFSPVPRHTFTFESTLLFKLAGQRSSAIYNEGFCDFSPLHYVFVHLIIIGCSIKAASLIGVQFEQSSNILCKCYVHVFNLLLSYSVYQGLQVGGGECVVTLYTFSFFFKYDSQTNQLPVIDYLSYISLCSATWF